MKKLPHMAADSVSNYLVSAHRYLELLLGRKIPILDRDHGGKRDRFHPFLAQQLSDWRRWHKPSERYEPYTVDMFAALHDRILQDIDPNMCFLGKIHAVYDWARLSVFTGFRIGEYGQSQLEKGHLFTCIPDDPDVPKEYRGMPLAMMACDFKFYTSHFVLIPHDQLHARHSCNNVQWLEIRWRYDKSANNFVTKRFRFTGHPIFCPVDTAVCILHRATLLGVKPFHPIGVWAHSPGNGYRFLHARIVTEVMRYSVDLAYPDPQHYMQQNKHRVVPHSNRVTAAVCLQCGGASNDEIVFKLRWHLTSVPTYLRDCFQAVGDILEKAIVGAMKLTFA